MPSGAAGLTLLLTDAMGGLSAQGKKSVAKTVIYEGMGDEG